MPPKEQATGDSIEAHYEQLVAQGAIRNDTAQREALEVLSALQGQLLKPRQSLFKRQSALLRGLYIWGNVGRGKSMLMDLFFEHVPVAKKRRVHFHSFMQEVYSRIHRLRQEK